MNKLDVNKDEYKDDKSKYDNSQALNSNESVINKNEAEEALTDQLMSTNFSINMVNYVIGTISLWKQNII